MRETDLPTRFADDRKKSVAVELWDKKKTPVCPTLSRSKRELFLSTTSYSYAWCPGWQSLPA